MRRQRSQDDQVPVPEAMAAGRSDMNVIGGNTTSLKTNVIITLNYINQSNFQKVPEMFNAETPCAKIPAQG